MPARGDPVKQSTEEARAEAGIHVTMLWVLVSVGTVDFCMKVPLGAQRGHCLVCNLQIHALFTPVNKGSEVAKFSLIPPEK